MWWQIYRYSLIHIALWCWAYFQVSWQLLYLWPNNFPACALPHTGHKMSQSCSAPKSVKVTWNIPFPSCKNYSGVSFSSASFPMTQIYNLLNERNNCKIVQHPIMLKVGGLLGKYLWWNWEKYLVMKLKTIWDDDEWEDWWGDMSWSPARLIVS